jgi:hypothetical protein
MMPLPLVDLEEMRGLANKTSERPTRKESVCVG